MKTIVTLQIKTETENMFSSFSRFSGIDKPRGLSLSAGEKQRCWPLAAGW